MSKEITGLKNINVLSKTQFENIEDVKLDELFLVSESGAGFPSSTYEDLTVGAAGTKYTAPANGWFAVTAKVENVTSGYVSYVTHSSGGRIICTSYGYGYGGAFIPCQKGQAIVFHYEPNVTDRKVRFIYAEGE